MHALHITLLSTAFAGLIVIWLGARCGSVRTKEKILHGDGGSPLMMKRMRAQANFVEYTPFALLLIAALELAGKGGWLLSLAAAGFLVGRILHAIGMDADTAAWPRMAGMILTLPVILGLAIAALLTAFSVI